MSNLWPELKKLDIGNYLKLNCRQEYNWRQWNQNISEFRINKTIAKALKHNSQ